jgi:ribosomal protein S18 acetylase RimI-like enzyme
METTAPSIRPATAEDAAFLAWIMLSASRAHLARGVWDLLIGADEAACLGYLRRLAVTEPRSLCHYESFLIAEIDGQPGAALSRFEIRAGGWRTVGEAMAKVQRDLGWTDSDLAGSQKRVAPIWACVLPEAGADFGVENVATTPIYRRRGLANALLNHTVREGISRGGKLAQVTTYIGNDKAVSAYKKCGFRVLDEKHCREMLSALGAPGFVRLVREL